MDFFYSIAGFFLTGGPFMYPILIVFAIGTAIATEGREEASLIDRRQYSGADIISLPGGNPPQDAVPPRPS